MLFRRQYFERSNTKSKQHFHKNISIHLCVFRIRSLSHKRLRLLVLWSCVRQRVFLRQGTAAGAGAELVEQVLTPDVLAAFIHVREIIAYLAILHHSSPSPFIFPLLTHLFFLCLPSSLRCFGFFCFPIPRLCLFVLLVLSLLPAFRPSLLFTSIPLFIL